MVESSEPVEQQPEAEDNPQVALINRVLDKIEEFYFEDGPESGEKLFACDVRFKVFLESENITKHEKRMQRKTFHL